MEFIWAKIGIGSIRYGCGPWPLIFLRKIVFSNRGWLLWCSSCMFWSFFSSHFESNSRWKKASVAISSIGECCRSCLAFHWLNLDLLFNIHLQPKKFTLFRFLGLGTRCPMNERELCVWIFLLFFMYLSSLSIAKISRGILLDSRRVLVTVFFANHEEIGDVKCLYLLHVSPLVCGEVCLPIPCHCIGSLGLQGCQIGISLGTSFVYQLFCMYSQRCSLLSFVFPFISLCHV